MRAREPGYGGGGGGKRTMRFCESLLVEPSMRVRERCFRSFPVFSSMRTK